MKAAFSNVFECFKKHFCNILEIFSRLQANGTATLKYIAHELLLTISRNPLECF